MVALAAADVRLAQALAASPRHVADLLEEAAPAAQEAMLAGHPQVGGAEGGSVSCDALDPPIVPCVSRVGPEESA